MHQDDHESEISLENPGPFFARPPCFQPIQEAIHRSAEAFCPPNPE